MKIVAVVASVLAGAYYIDNTAYHGTVFRGLAAMTSHIMVSMR